MIAVCQGCQSVPIECAHVRPGTDGGTGVKPTDTWDIKLCAGHHSQQHQIGERTFEAKHRNHLKVLAREFDRGSPYWMSGRNVTGKVTALTSKQRAIFCRVDRPGDLRLYE